MKKLRETYSRSEKKVNKKQSCSLAGRILERCEFSTNRGNYPSTDALILRLKSNTGRRT